MHVAGFSLINARCEGEGSVSGDFSEAPPAPNTGDAVPLLRFL